MARATQPTARKAKKVAKKATTPPAKKTAELTSKKDLVLRAFGGRKRSIDSVRESLEKAGHKLTDKDIRSAMDRIRAGGGEVTNEGRREFSVSAGA